MKQVSMHVNAKSYSHYSNVVITVKVLLYVMNVYTILSKVLAPPSNERFDYFSNFHEYKS